MAFISHTPGTDDNSPHVRARNPITRSQPNHRRKFPSHKAGRMVYCESALEYDFLLHCEFSPCVTGIAEQPQSIWYVMDGRKRRYTPDFLLETTTGDYLVEVKPAAKLEDDDTRAKFAVLNGWYKDHGEHLVVVTDDRIRIEPRLSNLKLLLRERRRSLCGVLGSQYVDRLRHLLPCTLRELAPHVGGSSILMGLLAAGHLHCDFGLPLEMAVVTAIPHKENDHVPSFLSC